MACFRNDVKSVITLNHAPALDIVYSSGSQIVCRGRF